MKPTEQGEVARDALAAIMREYRHLMGEETPEIRAALEALSHPMRVVCSVAANVTAFRSQLHRPRKEAGNERDTVLGPPHP